MRYAEGYDIVGINIRVAKGAMKAHAGDTAGLLVDLRDHAFEKAAADESSSVSLQVTVRLREICAIWGGDYWGSKA